MASNVNQYLRSALHHTDPPPAINVRYFYTSTVPIDDPLSPVPPPNTNSAALSRQPPKPFSEFDNTELDKAWQSLRREISKFNSQKEERKRRRASEERSRSRPVQQHQRQRGNSSSSSSSPRPGTPRTRAARPHASSLLNRVDSPASADAATAVDVTAEPLDASALNPEAASVSDTTGNPFVRAPSRKNIDTLAQSQHADSASRPKIRTQDTYDWEDASHLVDKPSPRLKASKDGEEEGEDKAPATNVAVGVSRLHQVEMPQLEMTPIYWTPVHDTASVVRGTWFYADTMLPVEPQVAVMLEAGYVDLRCWDETWKDELNSAIEVGAAGEEKIAHMLWPAENTSQSQSDGKREGRGVVSKKDGQGLLGVATSNIIEDDTPQTPDETRRKAAEAASLLIDTACGVSGPDNKAAGSLTYGRAGAVRNYSSFGVIYQNERQARLLKPSLLPSAYYGRRPLANYIRKGYKLGIPVVRGFDEAVWNKLHPPKTGTKAEKAGRGVAASSSGAPPTQRAMLDPDLAKAERPQVTDLIFVIHGIGQKLSQRMESFHFTHAINAFRREVNLEVGNKELRARFRGDMGNIMVLPINWRHSLSFEEGGYRSDGQQDPAINEFTLNDITPHTLPSVRNIVSDVMLDIPYYMSHHQPKMIAAVVGEANRVYQLWCKNNPGFAERGRVHIIAHSLGSVMAVDILSRQPTSIPPSLSDPTKLDLKNDQPALDHFLFNTHNLYLAGSPAGFFLLLKKAQLLPRIDSASATAVADPITNHLSVCGSRGTYGCLAVDNLYNIINPYDPVAYRMNAAVDSAFAASLKQAVIPSATPGWFGVGTKSSTSALFGSGGKGGNAASDTAVPTSASGNSKSGGNTELVTELDAATTDPAENLPPDLPRLPSNVELETHNFTREELAEKRMRLLNDNGQIDYFLRYGGGAFEIQYLTMLSAHSSYWLLGDFVRMVVTETGRVPGREGTFLGMRAQKVPLRKRAPGKK